MKRFDFTRAWRRIEAAQQAMNIAPTGEATLYWFRIWKARRRIVRFNHAKLMLHRSP